jgi:hypothetical protein
MRFSPRHGRRRLHPVSHRAPTASFSATAIHPLLFMNTRARVREPPLQDRIVAPCQRPGLLGLLGAQGGPGKDWWAIMSAFRTRALQSNAFPTDASRSGVS